MSNEQNERPRGGENPAERPTAMNTADLAAWLQEQIAEDEASARDAYYDGQRWIPEEEAVVAADQDLDPVLFLDRKRDARHAARWPPARVLADCEAKRAFVNDLLSEPHVVSEDCYYTCQAATEEVEGEACCDDLRRGGPCDCGRDARLDHRLRLLALPYADRPGYDES